MAIRVNPNRMELLQLKRKQQVAVRGHKLLKDKLEGLLKDFMEIIKEYKGLRNEVDNELSELFHHLILASASMQKQAYLAALSFPQCEVKLQVEEKLLMNVRIPKFNFTIEGNMLSYSFDSTNYDLDEAMGRMQAMIAKMVKLAELEKTIELVSAEIEKTRRRVNALEYILIPQQDEAIRYISSKLDELERSNTTRLMKIKDMLRM